MSVANLPFLAQRLFNRPLAVTPHKAEVVMAALGERFGVTRMFNGLNPVALTPYDLEDDFDDDARDHRPYGVLQGVAVIPIYGTLVAKLGSLRPWSGMTGYDGIRTNLQMAMSDPEVKAIVLDVDSPGGECAGMLDLSDAIYKLRGRKPMWSILNEEAYSAAYALASSADRIIVPRTGGVGSIGVIILHADMTQALSKDGITVTLIRYGTLKFEGSPYEVLSDDARARIQTDVDTLGGMFVDLVARNRNLSAQQVMDTQADTFLGSNGVTLGLADAVMAPDAAFAELRNSLD